jgi:predicted nucleic acid-binding protein
VKILFDTNVILEVMLLRKPFYQVVSFLLAEVEKKTIEGFICSTTVTTIHYLVSKAKGSKQARQQIENLFHIFQVAQVDQLVLEKALHSRIKDFEDAVIHEAALRQGVEGIVTRDPKDFRSAKLSIYDPEELLKMLLSVQS